MSKDAQIKGVEKLQRVYEISPTSEAIHALIDSGLNSAYDLLDLDPEWLYNKYCDVIPEATEKHRFYVALGILGVLSDIERRLIDTKRE